ncbi:molybdenum cofactor guanylyltransferase [Nocardioides gilvus]|uniref:molybdenum cofactor guanylyltransferase n=1 Tax=Nocardioides gilvus TaxID=1735589 RepID=UPI000D74815D|nr:NTP transferase domain-containing protein [Nocardioides gilvus]
MSQRSGFSAVILTGGTGRRMGGVDKAGLEVAGRPMLVWALTAVEGALETVVAGPEVTELLAGLPAVTESDVAASIRFVREHPAGGGPAAGLLAARDALTARAPYLLVLAVDMPRLSAATVTRLLEAAAGHDGAVLTDADGRRQLCLTVETAALDRVRPEGDAAGLSLFRLVAELDLVDVAPMADEASDIDTWDDLTRLDRPPSH